jgi:nucleoside-diphosphate-sugar epimerase
MGDTDLKVVVVGATGNVGTRLVEALGRTPEVASVLGMARRLPQLEAPKTEWVRGDITEAQLTEVFRGADVVIHLAWLFQPTHDPATTWRANVLGSIRVFDAVAAAEVPALVYASSVGAYSPGPKDRAVDESWPTHGWPGAAYTREKAYVERFLDAFEARHPDLRLVRLRPGFIFQREAASQQRRLFAGPLLPGGLVRPGTIPAVPDLPGLRFQVLHASDAADAYRLAATHAVRGAFNLAAEPVVDAALLADLLDATVVHAPARAVRGVLSTAWRLRLIPASPGLFDAVLRLPIMDTTRARDELGWTPRHDSRAAINAFLAGLREGAGRATAPLSPSVDGGRAHELRTGVGQKP